MTRYRSFVPLAILFALALGGCAATGKDSRVTASAAPQHSVLSRSAKWTITVQQDSASIVADPADASRYDTNYDFRVIKVAKGAHGTWVVGAKERAAQGPFAQGFQFNYRQQANGSVRLTSVQLAGRGSVPASQARGVVGLNFPLDLTISKAPVSRTVQPVGPNSQGLPPALPSHSGSGSTTVPPATSTPNSPMPPGG